MPHLVILYTPKLEALVEMTPLCRRLVDTMLSVRDEAGAQVFPTGGTRALAYPAAHAAVADGGDAGRAAGGDGDYGFVYLNLRMSPGRSEAVKKTIGDRLMATLRDSFAPLLEKHHLGLTLLIDESAGQIYDGKLSSLHPLFR